MTKLIALLAVLVAVAWGITATASWIAKKKAPLALAGGRTPAIPSPGEEDKAMMGAQLRTVGGIVFAAVIFAALFRVSIGLAGQAGMAIALTAGLSASGGLFLYSALPARKQPASNTTAPNKAAPNKAAPNTTGQQQPVVSTRDVILPGAALLAFFIFLAVAALAPVLEKIDLDGSPLAVVSALFAGATALAVHRVKTTLSLPDPRMAGLDRKWRQHTARNLLLFAGGVLLAGLGSTAFMIGLALLNGLNGLSGLNGLNGTAGTVAAQPVPFLAPACVAGGAALAAAGVVLMVLAAKGTLGMRTAVRKGAERPITA